MNEYYASLIRYMLLKVAIVILKMVSGNFRFKNIYLDKNTDQLMVKFIYKQCEQSEDIDNFIHSDFFYLLSRQELEKVIQTKLNYMSQYKTIRIEQDPDLSEIFSLINFTNRQTIETLAKDIFYNDAYLENMYAKDIRLIAQSVLLPQNNAAQPNSTKNNFSLQSHNNNIIPIQYKREGSHHENN